MESIGHLLNYTVDKETCIGCRACAEAFPEHFQMDDDENKAYVTGLAAGAIDWREPVIACPVDSIAVVDFKGRLLLPPQPVRDGDPLPPEGIDLMVKDYEALPPDQRPVIEVKPAAKAGAGGVGLSGGALPEQWFRQFVAPAMAEDAEPPRFRPWVIAALRLGNVVWGGFSERFKTRLMELSGEDPRISPGAATTLNALLNFLVYPAVVWFLASGRLEIFGFHPLGVGLEGTALLATVLVLGVGYAFVEFAFRLKDEIFDWGITERDRVYPAAIYMAPLSGAAVDALERACASPARRKGLYDEPVRAPFDPERERLYGRAFHAAPLDLGGDDVGVQIDVEFPARLRLSSGREIEIPEYEHDVTSTESGIVVRARITDPSVASLWSYRDPFPLSFERTIAMPAQVASIDEEKKGRTLRLRVLLQK